MELSPRFPILLDNPRAWRTYLGGTLLDELHGQPPQGDNHFPEEWIMSVTCATARPEVPDEGLSHVAQTGQALRDLIKRDPAGYLGPRHLAKQGEALGVLIKLIDSAERLSIQVHPDREAARRLFDSPFGKTECWYILGGREINGAPPCIYFGFKQGVTQQEWKRCFDEQDIKGMLQCLHRFDVTPGQTILIEGGMPHAIGAGCLIAEIQEPTDITIRTDRITPSGYTLPDRLCHQGIGFEKMFECFHYNGMSAKDIQDRWFLPARVQTQEEGGSIRTLVGYEDTTYFAMDEILVSRRLCVPGTDVFSGLYVLEGEGELLANGSVLPIKQGQQYFVPAQVGNFTLQTAGAPLRVLHCFGPKAE